MVKIDILIVTTVVAINWVFSGNLLMLQNKEKPQECQEVERRQKIPLNKAEYLLWFCNYIPLSALASNGEKEKSGHIKKKKKACF